jgi:hypothetical protein
VQVTDELDAILAYLLMHMPASSVSARERSSLGYRRPDSGCDHGPEWNELKATIDDSREALQVVAENWDRIKRFVNGAGSTR